ncbi:MAG: tRNA glutamyl-Q(34) synthetase GluQRS [Telmatospirillum sp.]|nr:tRNA glutamyl-Q(34) synthetase GluQRS [Telmatospirillum sp.]
MPIVTRFAPSPSGELHLGHAFSALFAAGEAAKGGGRFLVRIEDIDTSRCRDVYVAGLLEDLAWLGLSWEQPVRRQSDHWDDYGAALSRLDRMGLLYPCFCTRADIAREIAQAGGAPQGPDGPRYPGLCRSLSVAEREDRIAAGQPYALRIDMDKAMAMAGPLTWTDRREGVIRATPDLFGDVVLARKDVPASYHLAVTVDDALQDVTLVTRGRDLFAATHIHRLLQALLELPVPEWHHHRLLTDASGRRLAKRDRATSLSSLRRSGLGPDDVRAMIGPC